MTDPHSPEVQFEALKHERNVLQKICAERSDEIERLRAALKEARDLIDNHEQCGPGSTDFGNVVQGIDKLLGGHQQSRKSDVV